MKNLRILLLLPGLCFLSAYSQDLTYFLPQGDFVYNEDIPTPKAFFGHELGEQHATYDMTVSYMRLLAEKSDRIRVEERGRTYQYRPLQFLYISTPGNLDKLEDIRLDHLKLCDAKVSDKLAIHEMPVVIWLGYSIHGNEASGINASLAVAYFLAAAKGPEIDRILSNAVIVMQPGTNPDGIQRFASWVNSARSFTPVKDPNTREFREPAPNSRTNHYWFDLNRDWFTVQHPESYYRAQIFYEWHPTLLADHHEHNNINGMFFSPGIPTSHNPVIPKDNLDFIIKIAQQYHSKFLNSIGTLTFSKEIYDGWYPGKGGVMPDLLGGVGFLFEQPSSRGHIQERNKVTIKFADAIRNQAYGSYSIINAGVDMKDELLNYQRKSYKEAQQASSTATVKAYVFGNPENKSLDVELFRMLKSNHIDVYKLNKQVTVSGKTFQSDDSYIVPCEQQEYRMVRTIFEKHHTFVDSVFYDISTWTVPLAFSMNYGELNATAGLIGEKVEQIVPSQYEAPRTSNFAYLFEVKDFYAYRFLYRLLALEIKVRAGDTPFQQTIDGQLRNFGYGTLMIPVNNQKYNKEDLYRIIVETAKDIPVEVVAAYTGWADPFDLGSQHFKEISLPKIALIWDQGASSDGVGAVWHLLDQRMKIPATLLENTLIDNANVDLMQYNLIVLCDNIRLSRQAIDKLKAWVNNGSNTIVGIGRAYQCLNELDLASIHTLGSAKNVNPSTYLDYSTKTDIDPNSVISGVILESYLDKSHPVAYGINANTINTIKTDTVIISIPEGKYMCPANYKKSPLLSGCITTKNLKILAETPSILASRKAIYFVDDPCFRAYWFGSMRLLLNSFFFRELMPAEKIKTENVLSEANT